MKNHHPNINNVASDNNTILESNNDILHKILSEIKSANNIHIDSMIINITTA